MTQSSNEDTFTAELYLAVSAFLGGQHENIAPVFTEMLSIMDAQLSLMEMDALNEASTYGEALDALQALSNNLPGAIYLKNSIKLLRACNGSEQTEQRIKNLHKLHKLVIDSLDKLENDD